MKVNTFCISIYLLEDKDDYNSKFSDLINIEPFWFVTRHLLEMAVSPVRYRSTLACSFCCLFFLALCSPLTAATDFAGSACLGVSPTQFAGSLTQVITAIKQLASILSRFSMPFADFRLATAIADCLDLFDISSDVLSWALSASQNPKGIKSKHCCKSHYQWKLVGEDYKNLRLLQGSITARGTWAPIWGHG